MLLKDGSLSTPATFGLSSSRLHTLSLSLSPSYNHIYFTIFCFIEELNWSILVSRDYHPKLDKAKQESRSKDEALRKLEENYQNLECKSKNKDHFSRNQQEKVTELEVKLESRTEFCKQFEKQLMQRSDQLKEKEEICMTLQHKVFFRSLLSI